MVGGGQEVGVSGGVLGKVGNDFWNDGEGGVDVDGGVLGPVDGEEVGMGVEVVEVSCTEVG